MARLLSGSGHIREKRAPQPPLRDYGYPRAGLLDGTLTTVIAHPLQRMAKATPAEPGMGKQTTIPPFDTFTRENK